MRFKPPLLLLGGMLLFHASAFSQDTNLFVFLCFGQSNMDGAGKIEEQDLTVDKRFQVLAALDFPKIQRKTGIWYDAVPPLCRGTGGLSPSRLLWQDAGGQSSAAHSSRGGECRRSRLQNRTV